MTKTDKTDQKIDAPVSENIGNPNNIHDDGWEKRAWEDTEDIERDKGENGEPGGVDVGLGTRGDLPDQPKGNLDDVDAIEE